MRPYRTRLLVVGAALLFVLSGCASGPANNVPDVQVSDNGVAQEPAPEQDSDTTSDVASSDISIPAGAYAGTGVIAFPIPEGWTELDPFAEGKLGKDVTISGSVEYPGDAEEAATTYLDVLKAAGFDAYTYGPGELTNKASLAAEGRISGIPYFALLNFDVHADGYQRVSIIIIEED